MAAADVWEFEPAVREGLRRYARLVASLIRAANAKPAPSGLGDATHVEAGVVFGQTVVAGGSVDTPPVAIGRVVDRLGHDRPLYKPLLVYALARGSRAAPPYAGELAAAWDGPADAAAGDRVAAAAWAALAEWAIAKSPGPVGTMRWLVDGQQPSGAFLAARPSDNLESLWFHELAILHAVASFAVQTREPGLWPAVVRAVRYHLEETQPDHATNQPWGLTAFLLEPDGWPIADSMLHAASAHAAVEGDASQGLTLMLLADALYCLHQLGITE